MQTERRERIIASLSVSLFFSFTVFCFGPTHIYFTNIILYSYSFLRMTPFFVGVPLFFSLLVAVPLTFMKPSIHQRVISLLFTLSFLLWLQGNVLVWDYGLLDGTDVDWSAKTTFGLIDGGIWAAFLIISLVAARHISRFAQKTSVAFIVIQLISGMLDVTRVPETNRLYKEPLGKEKSIFRFSPEKNVVILCLDSFQGDVFQEIINEDTRYRDIFDGFTCYRDALSGYPHTGAAVSLILSGRFYENSAPFSGFKKEIFTSDSIPKALMEKGYQVDLLGPAYFFHVDETIASNRIAIKDLVDQNVILKDAVFTFDVSLSRQVPHFVKKYVYGNQSWFTSRLLTDKELAGFPPGFHRDDIKFMKKMASRADSGGGRPTFKYIHLKLPHLPARINERLEYRVMEANRENFKRQAKGTLELVNTFLENLKKAGIYDKTMIFILADHGSGFRLRVEDNAGPQPAGAGSPEMEWMMSRASIIFLAKPFEATGVMKISDAPISLSDVAKTIASELGLDAGIPGNSVFAITEAHMRNRRFLYHTWYMNFWEHDYFPPIEEHRVTGFGWRKESWHPTGNIFEAEGAHTIW